MDELALRYRKILMSVVAGLCRRLAYAFDEMFNIEALINT